MLNPAETGGPREGGSQVDGEHPLGGKREEEWDEELWERRLEEEEGWNVNK